MKCPKCGKNLPFGAVACGNCGAKFKTVKCPHCGRDILPGLPYCPGCQKDIKWNSANPGTLPSPNNKKPLTKQWWFWALCTVLVLGILGNIINAFTGASNGQSQIPSPPAASPNSDIFSSAPAGKGDVMDGTKTDKTSELPSENKDSAESSSKAVPEPTAEPVSTPAPTADVSQSETSSDTAKEGNSNFNIYDNSSQQQTEANYVLNTNSLKIHHPSCQAVKKIAPQNYQEFTGSIDDLLSQGYTTCGICFK